MGFPGGSQGKESACNVGDLGFLLPGLGRSPGDGHGNPLQYSCLENPHGQGCLVGYSPWGCKESYDWATKHTVDNLFSELACCFEKPCLSWRVKGGQGRKVFSSSLWLLWRLALCSSLAGVWLGRLVVVTEGSGSRNEAVNELVSGWNGAALLSWGMGTPRDWVSPACSVEAKHVTSVHLFPLL